MANQTEERIIEKIEELATLLGGNTKQMLRCNSMGRQSNIIEIEYNVKETK